MSFYFSTIYPVSSESLTKYWALGRRGRRWRSRCMTGSSSSGTGGMRSEQRWKIRKKGIIRNNCSTRYYLYSKAYFPSTNNPFRCEIFPRQGGWKRRTLLEDLQDVEEEGTQRRPGHPHGDSCSSSDSALHSYSILNTQSLGPKFTFFHLQ